MDFRKETSIIFGLASRCPYRCEERACPLGAVRKLPLNERYEAIREIPLPERLRILHLHRDCASDREQ
jgi:hypothetical protein